MLRPFTPRGFTIIPSCSRRRPKANRPAVYSWIGTNEFQRKTGHQRFIVVCSSCHQKLKFGFLTLLFCRVHVAKKYHEVCAERAARLHIIFLSYSSYGVEVVAAIALA